MMEDRYNFHFVPRSFDLIQTRTLIGRQDFEFEAVFFITPSVKLPQRSAVIWAETSRSVNRVVVRCASYYRLRNKCNWVSVNRVVVQAIID